MKAEQRVKELVKESNGSVGYYFTRGMLLFAKIKLVRLDPR